LYSDASLQGWGGFDKTHNLTTGGHWSMEEQTQHINILELKACKFTLMAFCKDISNKHVRIFMDNTNSISYINNYGGRTEKLDNLAREIWICV